MSVDTAGGRVVTPTALGRPGPDGSVLVFGVVADRADPADVTEVDHADASRVQLGRRFGRGLIAAGTWDLVPPEDRRLLVHNLVTHMLPGADVRIDVGEGTHAEATGHAVACGLEPVAGPGPLRFRRTSRTTIHDLVAEARTQLVRITPQALAVRLAVDSDCAVLDTRTPTDRERFGILPGSAHIPRTTLEWRVDPSSGYSHPAVRSLDQCLVVICSEGYSSSLAAVSLQRLGFVHATDLVGGFAAWRDAGLPIEHAP